MGNYVEGGKKADVNAALRDKRDRVMTKKRSWRRPVALAIGAVVIAAIGIWPLNMMKTDEQAGMRSDFPPRNEQVARAARASIMKVEGGVVRIPRASVEDGNAHFFAYPAGEKSIFFFAMRASDGSIRVAYDACVACNHAKRGYRQEGDRVVCNNCGMDFMPTEIGVQTGGCNPIPLRSKTEGAVIVVRATDLEAGARYF